MPTENRSSNTEMVSVPLVERLTCLMQDLTFMKDRNTIREAIALLAQLAPFPGYPPVPEDRKLANAQHQGEPVAFTTKGMLDIAKQLPLTGRIGAKVRVDERWNVPLYTRPEPDEVRMLRVDAERYRWLRSRDLETISESGVFAGITPDNLVINEETLDQAIDAALSASAEPSVPVECDQGIPGTSF